MSEIKIKETDIICECGYEYELCKTQFRDKIIKAYCCPVCHGMSKEENKRASIKRTGDGK